MSPEEMDFLVMSVPLEELIKGVGEYQVEQDIVAIAHMCLQYNQTQVVIDHLPQIWAPRRPWEARMSEALEQTLELACAALRLRGHVQMAAEIEERVIRHVDDIPTHLGRIKTDMNAYTGTDAHVVLEALVHALRAFDDIRKGTSNGNPYECILRNLIYLTAYESGEAADKHSATYYAWDMILVRWLSGPLAE